MSSIQKGVSDFLFVSLAKVLNGGLTILFNILLLRYLGPEQFGVFSLCVVVILFADGTIGSALDMGVMRLSTDRHRTRFDLGFYDVEIAALVLKIIITLLISLLLFIGSDVLSNLLFHQGSHGQVIWLTMIAASGLLLLRTLQTHCQLSGMFGFYSIADFLHTFLKFGGIGFILVMWSAKLEYILFAFALAPLSVAVVGLAVFFVKSSVHWGEQSQAMKELIRFVKWIILTYIITASVSRLDIFLLSRFSSLEELGIFSSGLIFASIPELLGSYMAVVLNPRVLPYYRDGRFLSFFRHFQLFCLAGSLFVMGVAYFAIDPLCEILFPSSYSGAAAVFLALLPGSLITMAVFPLTLPFLLYVRPRFFLVMDCLSLPILFALYIPAIEQHDALGAAWVTGIAKVVKGLVAQILAWKLATSNAPGLIKS